MAVKLTDEFGNRANPSSSAYPNGSLKDETSPGVSNDGSPLSSRVGNDFQGFMQSALAEAGIDANGNPDSVENPQILNALKKVVKKDSSCGLNLIYNSGFSIAGSVANPPDETPRSYSAGDELFSGFKAVGPLSGVTYIDGKLNGTGQLYVDVYKDEKQKLSTVSHVASIASSDCVPVESGASFADNGDYWRVTFEMINTFSLKLEQGSIPTIHKNKDSSITDLKAPFINRLVSSSMIDKPDAKFFGIKGGAASFDSKGKLQVNSNAFNDTVALQNALDWSSETGKKIQITDFIGINSKVVHRGCAKVEFGGYIVPLIDSWDGSTTVYEINSEFYDQESPDLSARYLTDRASIEGALRINPGFGKSVPATGVIGERGAGVIVENAIIHGCTKGGFFIKKGYEWNTGRIIATAPEDVESGAQLFYTDTSDGNHQYIGGKGYNKGVVIDSNGTNNTIERAHPWGYTSQDAIQGENNKLLMGFEIQGSYNTIKSGCADTVRRKDNSQPASYANGGIGFYSGGYGNNFESPLTIAQKVDGDEKIVNIWLTKSDNSITNSTISTPDGIEHEGEVRFNGNADITNTTIVGGNVGVGWLYTTKERPRNLTNNLTTSSSEPNQYQKIKYQINKEIVTGTITISQYITDNSSTDNVYFYLPDMFSSCSGDFAVYDTYPFSNALVDDFVNVVALFRNGVLRFQRRKVDGTAETITQNMLKVASGSGGSQNNMFNVNVNVLVALPSR
tara:strand:- start:5626 stop:7833 length:2208 start_codon:yes stop_codon:yes gene_type:complete